MTIEDLANKRLNICYKCPLYKKDVLGERCNSQRYINPDTDEWSYFPKKGYIKGCNCIVTLKAKNPKGHCVAGKW